MRIIRGVLAAIIIATATCVCAAEHPTAADLLKGFAKSVDKMTCVRFDTQESAHPAELGDDRWLDRTESRIVRDGERWKLDAREKAVTASAKLDTGVWRQTLIEGDILQAEVVNPDDAKSRTRLSVYRYDRPEQYWRFLGPAAIVFGRLPGDGGSPVWGIVGDSSTREVLPQTVEIDGAETYVVKSRGQYGEHQLWLDPRRGGLPLRIEIRKQSGNLNDDDQLGSQAATGADGSVADAISIRIDNIKLSKQEGVHFIAAFDYAFTATFPTGNAARVFNHKRAYRISSMDMFSKAVTDARFCFDMQIPNGTRVDVFRNSRLGTGSTAASDSEVWVDGKLQQPTNP